MCSGCPDFWVLGVFGTSDLSGGIVVVFVFEGVSEIWGFFRVF